MQYNCKKITFIFYFLPKWRSSQQSHDPGPSRHPVRGDSGATKPRRRQPLPQRPRRPPPPPPPAAASGGGRPKPAPREPLPRLLLSPSASLPFLPSLPFAGVRWGSGVSPARSEALTSGSVVLGHGSGRPRAGGRLTPPGLGCHQRWWWAAGAPCCAPWGGAAAAGACPLLCRRSSLPMCLVVACRTSSGLAPRSSELSTGLGRRRRPPPLLLYRQAEAHATRFACPAGRVKLRGAHAGVWGGTAELSGSPKLPGGRTSP